MSIQSGYPASLDLWRLAKKISSLVTHALASRPHPIPKNVKSSGFQFPPFLDLLPAQLKASKFKMKNAVLKWDGTV